MGMRGFIGDKPPSVMTIQHLPQWLVAALGTLGNKINNICHDRRPEARGIGNFSLPPGWRLSLPIFYMPLVAPPSMTYNWPCQRHKYSVNGPYEELFSRNSRDNF